MKPESDHDWLTRQANFHGIELTEDDVEYFLERCAVAIESVASAPHQSKFSDIVKTARNRTLRKMASRKYLTAYPEDE